MEEDIEKTRKSVVDVVRQKSGLEVRNGLSGSSVIVESEEYKDKEHSLGIVNIHDDGDVSVMFHSMSEEKNGENAIPTVKFNSVSEFESSLPELRNGEFDTSTSVVKKTREKFEEVVESL